MKKILLYSFISLLLPYFIQQPLAQVFNSPFENAVPYDLNNGKEIKEMFYLDDVKLLLKSQILQQKNQNYTVIKKYSNAHMLKFSQAVSFGASNSTNPSIVQEEIGIPVFIDKTKNIFVPIGGVIIAFKAQLNEKDILQFFLSHNIKDTHIKKLFLKNNYLVETTAGYPALEMTNKFANSEKIEYINPNWWHPVEKF